MITHREKPIVALLTDFGHRDHYVGVMKGVILGICPDATILDVCHEIPPQDISGAAYLLATSLPYLPPGTIVVVVVDPGVGTSRRAIAVEIDGRVLIGPDNGLFTMAFDACEPRVAIELDRGEFHLPDVSKTFHGRDIFSPCAAHLANGEPLEGMGSEVAIAELVRLARLVPRREERELVGAILHIDHFGNMITNLSQDACDLLRKEHTSIWIDLPDIGRSYLLRETFEDVPPGEPLAYCGSGGLVEIAVRGGDASHETGLNRGARVVARAQRGH